MAPRRTKSVDTDELARLARKLEALEDRLRLLENRVRAAMAPGRRAGPGPTASRNQRRAGRRRPRCPGCTLELPPGRRGEQCVWCGFRFDAMKLWQK